MAHGPAAGAVGDDVEEVCLLVGVRIVHLQADRHWAVDPPGPRPDHRRVDGVASHQLLRLRCERLGLCLERRRLGLGEQSADLGEHRIVGLPTLVASRPRRRVAARRRQDRRQRAKLGEQHHRRHDQVQPFAVHRRPSLDEVGQPCLGRDVVGLERLDLCGPLRMDGRRDVAVVVDNDQGGDHSTEHAIAPASVTNELARLPPSLPRKADEPQQLLLGDRGDLVERGRDEDLEIVICAPAAVVLNACHRPQGLADPTLAGWALPRDVVAELVACPRTGRLSAGARPPLCVLPPPLLVADSHGGDGTRGVSQRRGCRSFSTLRSTSGFDEFRSGAACRAARDRC